MNALAAVNVLFLVLLFLILLFFLFEVELPKLVRFVLFVIAYLGLALYLIKVMVVGMFDVPNG